MSAKGTCIAERFHVTGGLYPIAVSGLTTEPDYVNMKNYGHLTIVILAGVANGTGQTVTVKYSSAASGGTAMDFNYYKTIVADADVLGTRTLAAAATGLLLSHGTISNTKYVIEIDAAELPDGYPWVGLVMSGATSTTPVAVTYILSGSRYESPASATAIA
jgi:hypothetical protein